MSRTIRMSRLVATAAVAAVVVAACSPATDSPAPTSPATTPEPAVEAVSSPAPEPEEPEAPLVVPEKLQFTATTLAGDTFEGASILGTPTILWFWAEWCPNCKAEATLVADALDELPDNVQFYGVPGRSGQEGMERFVSDHGLEGIVHIVDADGSLWANFTVASQPALAVIDAEGNVRVIPGSNGKSGILQAAQEIA